MANRMSYWMLLTAQHITDTYKDFIPESRYEIAPDSKIKKGDTVYLWWVIDGFMFGWGVVSETPRISESLDPQSRKRLTVTVRREVGFEPTLTKLQVEADRSLVGMIPSIWNDLYAIPLNTLQAYHLNDVIRTHGLDAPKGSAPVRWWVDESPEVVIKALLEPFPDFGATILRLGDRTNEGRLVEGVALPWLAILDRFRRNPEEMYAIDPRTWEEIVAGAYVEAGFDEVVLTPRSGDKGRDVIATKKGIGSIRIFDQVKAYKPGHVVTAEEVRAFLHVVDADRNVSKGVMTTTSDFAPRLMQDPYIQPYIPHRLELKPRDVLFPWLDELRSARHEGKGS